MRLKKRHARNDTPAVLPCHDRWGGGRNFRSNGRQRIVRICRRETGRDDAKIVSMTWAAQRQGARRKRWAQASCRCGLRCRGSIRHRRTNPGDGDCSSHHTSRADSWATHRAAGCGSWGRDLRVVFRTMARSGDRPQQGLPFSKHAMIRDGGTYALR